MDGWLGNHKYLFLTDTCYKSKVKAQTVASWEASLHCRSGTGRMRELRKVGKGQVLMEFERDKRLLSRICVVWLLIPSRTWSPHKSHATIWMAFTLGMMFLRPKFREGILSWLDFIFCEHDVGQGYLRRRIYN